MSGNKKSLKTNFTKVDGHIIQPDEYAELPEWTEEMFLSADLFHGEKLIRRGRGRPVQDIKKATLNMRVDADVLDALRARGKGWQTEVSNLLRHWVEQQEAKK